MECEKCIYFKGKRIPFRSHCKLKNTRRKLLDYFHEYDSEQIDDYNILAEVEYNKFYMIKNIYSIVKITQA